jgi:tRNA A37 threonylcarbamoyladenosine synthetase subunit TsaC/SUA5/YrdC
MLKKDEIFITTTDTLIGIGSKINNDNLKALYQLKQRPLDKKIVIVISSIEQLKKMENIDQQTLEYIEKY